MNLTCEKCRLAKTRHQIVKGRGTLPAQVLFIGEAPGVSEDVLGVAFIGESGRLLDKMVGMAGLDGDPLYFTNTVLCRPCTEKAGANRQPMPDEILACQSNVEAIIAEAQPVHVVLVGDVAERYYRKRFEIYTKITHPAALLRAGGTRAPGFRENCLKLSRLTRLNSEGATVLPVKP